jgi:pyridoxamine 5'-phosphate oxidase
MPGLRRCFGPMEIVSSSCAAGPEQHGLGLREEDLDRDPFRQFADWFDQALKANLPEVNAMALATASRDGNPAARIVLLKSFDAQGFVFFTNYDSPKGRHLAENPQAALLFFWPALERQIRISGTVTKVSREESEFYFHTRPVGSQIGAWASQQSQVLSHRHELDERVRLLARQYADQEVPLPPHWGGYRVQPVQFEFWQARTNRLHDRFLYSRPSSDAPWTIARLSP